MDGTITFKNPLTGLVDSTGTAITDGTVVQTQVIPKKAVLRLRVLDVRDTTNPNMLTTLALRMELATVSDPSSGSTPDVVTLGRLDAPNNTTIPKFFAYVDQVRVKLSSNNDEELVYTTTFP